MFLVGVTIVDLGGEGVVRSLVSGVGTIGLRVVYGVGSWGRSVNIEVSH